MSPWLITPMKPPTRRSFTPSRKHALTSEAVLWEAKQFSAHKQFARSNTVVWAEVADPGCRSASSLGAPLRGIGLGQARQLRCPGPVPRKST